MRVVLMLSLIFMGAIFDANAQATPELVLLNTQIGTRPDGFGGEARVVTGEVFNHGTGAYRNISITVEAYNAADELIGEGFGYLVNACGTALLDYALPPERVQPYEAPYELFAAGEVAQVKLSVAAEPASLDSVPPPTESELVTRIAFDEVVSLEWLDEDTLIYGVGCEGAVFTELAWWQYHTPDHALSEVEHPDAHKVTPEMIERSAAAMITQSGKLKPELYFGSQMTYSPTARRIVYQNDLHSIYSAEPDGTYKRLIHQYLHQHSLRGFLWARNPGVFLAYYFGAYGDPVHYFAAHVDGARVTGLITSLPPSQTVPGPSPDGIAAVVGRQEGDLSGYFWQTTYGGSELLFEAELPGNNYPAPIVTSDEIYLIRPIDGLPTLQCFSRRTRELKTISPLPLQLTRLSRAWSWLSPEGGKLALAANGVDGGLWRVDTAGGCG